jgi:hypothetical protein
MLKVAPSQLPSNKKLAWRALTCYSKVSRGQFINAETWKIIGFGFNQHQLSSYCACFGFSEHFVPLSYLFVATQQAQLSFLSQSSAKVKLLGLVHVSIEFEQDVIIDAYSEYDIRFTLGEQLWTDKGLQFDVVVDFLKDNQRMAGFVSRYIQLSPVTSSKNSDNKSNVIADPPLWTPIKQVQFSKSVGRKYASISRDYNPIHLTPLLSKLFGFKRPIVHGMYSAALILSAQTMGSPTRVTVRFKKPILMPNQAKLANFGSRWALLLNDDRVAVQVDIEV